MGRSHQGQALGASFASPCPSSADGPLSTWCCLLPTSSLSCLSHAFCAPSIVTTPQTGPPSRLCALSASSRASLHLSPQKSLPDFQQAHCFSLLFCQSTHAICLIRARLHPGEGSSVGAILHTQPLDSLKADTLSCPSLSGHQLGHYLAAGWYKNEGKIDPMF